MDVYIVLAYRWGNRDGPSYPIGTFSSFDLAFEKAQLEATESGGKFKCSITQTKLDTYLEYDSYVESAGLVDFCTDFNVFKKQFEFLESAGS